MEWYTIDINNVEYDYTITPNYEHMIGNFNDALFTLNITTTYTPTSWVEIK